LKANPHDDDIRDKLHASVETVFRHFENLADNPDKMTSSDREEAIEFNHFLNQIDTRLYDGETIRGFGMPRKQ